jgi:hypothetical protein
MKIDRDHLADNTGKQQLLDPTGRRAIAIVEGDVDPVPGARLSL